MLPLDSLQKKNPDCDSSIFFGNRISGVPVFLETEGWPFFGRMTFQEIKIKEVFCGFFIPFYKELFWYPGHFAQISHDQVIQSDLFIPCWRSLNHLKGSLNHPKKVTKNCQGGDDQSKKVVMLEPY